MSDRDKKLILGVFIVCIALLPYFFYIKDKKVETQAIENENVELRARLAELQAMDANRQWYLDETARYNAERDAIIALFPADINQVNYIMFLLDSEYSSVRFLDDETSIWEYPFRFASYTFAESEETPISATDVEVDGVAIDSVESVDTGFVGISNYSELTFGCKYDALKYMLVYLKDYVDPITYKSLKLDFDTETGQINGSMLLAQYAIAGEDRALPEEDFISTFDGRDFDFSIDSMDIRGNEEVGIFGPYVQPPTDVEDNVETEENGEGEEADDSDDDSDETVE